MATKRSFMTGDEKTFLKEIVTGFINIIENKKTDAVSVSDRKKVWQTIAKQFNAIGEHCNRTPDQLRKCWENMKSRRKKELATEKMNRMATGGGFYKPPNNGDDAVVDDIFSSVDIELKDTFDSDTIAIAGISEIVEHPDVSVVAGEGTICMPLNAYDEDKDDSDLPVEVLPTPKTLKKKRQHNSRGTAIERELEIRLARTKRAIEQDEELHKLQVEEQQIKIRIALEILKQEEIKTKKLLE